MSKYEMLHKAPFAACAAIIISSMAVPATAQNPVIVPEQGFTVAPAVQTPIVLKTQSDAACDLHPLGVNDAAHTMRLYANPDGYVRLHVTAKEQSQPDTRLQLDCAAGGRNTTYPLHLRAGSSPSADMPAPPASIPTPTGTRVLPALTDEAAQQLSDTDVITLGYPPRPDAATAPDHYAKWLDLVSRPITLLPSHTVSHSGISHMPGAVVAGIKAFANWSGLEKRGTFRNFDAVEGEWYVPFILVNEPGSTTRGAFWVGLDGDGTKDLVQAGTEQDDLDLGVFGYVTQYYTWTEVVPNQPEQGTALSVNPGDDIFVEVWIGDSAGNYDAAGGYAHFMLANRTSHQEVEVKTPLDGTYFNGSEAEWIMERPCISLCGSATPVYADLSSFIMAQMWNANAKTAGKWVFNPATASDLQLFMYENFTPHPDNNVLSTAASLGPEAIQFLFANFH